MKRNFPGYINTDDGERIFYSTNFSLTEENQEQPLLVFNYGLVCSNLHWSKQIPFFEELGFHILLHDYRGHFNSSARHIENCTFYNFAKDIKHIIDLIAPSQVIMLGHSMGVNVTLEFARNYPQDVAGMIIIAGTVFPPQDIMFDSNLVDLFMPYLELLSTKYPEFFKKAWKATPLIPLAQKLIHKGGFNTKKVPIEFIQIYLNKIGQLPPELFFQLFRQMAEHDILPHLKEILTPTLVIGGQKDHVIPYYIQNIIHQNLPHSELYAIRDGSHVPQADFPELINERMFYFIKNILGDSVQPSLEQI